MSPKQLKSNLTITIYTKTNISYLLLVIKQSQTPTPAELATTDMPHMFDL